MVIFFCAILVTHKLVYTSFSKKKKLLYTQVSLQLPLVFNKKNLCFGLEIYMNLGWTKLIGLMILEGMGPS